MPAVSDRQANHLMKLNATPAAAANRFASGVAPWNKLPRVTVSCHSCGGDVQKTEKQIARSKLHFCGRDCQREWRRQSPSTDAIFAMFSSGMKIREIAAARGVSMGTVSNAIAVARSKADDKKYRSRSGKTFVSNKLPDACELCGYDRCVDLAHVVPAREGGTYAISNCLALCPNCHHLFDHDLLTTAEYAKVDELIQKHKEMEANASGQ